MHNRYVFTGGPGAGKTTVLTALEERGYCCVPESARRIIQARLSAGLSPRPDPATFAQNILESDVTQYRKYGGANEPVFFDRGVPDALYMLHAADVRAKGRIVRHMSDYAYAETVFVFPPWEAIYTTDAERDQTFDESKAVFEAMRDWYQQWGYKTLAVPHLDVEQRAAFVLAHARQP